MANKQIPLRILKIGLFSVVFGFVGFAACMPAHRTMSPYVPPSGCPLEAKIQNNVCVCPNGGHVANGRCVPQQPLPQNP